MGINPMHGFVRPLACAVALSAACTLLLRAEGAAEDPALSYQRAAALWSSADYLAALHAFDAASRTDDPVLAMRARKGKIRAALKIAEFESAWRDAERLVSSGGIDAESRALHGDAQWAMGLFDEAEAAYGEALDLDGDLAQARAGLARALASRGRLEAALPEVQAGLALAPRDPDLHAIAGGLLERLNRYGEAARAYESYAALLPPAEKAAIVTARSRAAFLRSFGDRVPLEVDDRDARETHVLPFKLIRNKVVVQGRVNGVGTSFVLDTGAERTGLSRGLAARAGARPVTTTITAGVGAEAWRRVALARVDRLEIGSLLLRNVPAAVRDPAAGGPPRWQGESLSPLALGFSVVVDYGRQRVTLARTLPPETSDIRLPMRFHRLPMVRGLLNSTHRASFIVDTGGETLSISGDTASVLGLPPPRHIPLRVFGLAGLDETAFLLPGVDLQFEDIGYRKIGLAVLNLRAPSVLLGFQVGGIVGHILLGKYRVALDVERSEVRLGRPVAGGPP